MAKAQRPDIAALVPVHVASGEDAKALESLIAQARDVVRSLVGRAVEVIAAIPNEHDTWHVTAGWAQVSGAAPEFETDVPARTFSSVIWQDGPRDGP